MTTSRPIMNNTSNFIMRDQVHNLIPSIMQHGRERLMFRFVSQVSLAIVSLATFKLLF